MRLFLEFCSFWATTLDLKCQLCIYIYFPLCFLSYGPSTRLRVMASPSRPSQPHLLDTPHSIGLLWTSDQTDAETPNYQHTTITRERLHAPAGFEPTIPAIERPQSHALGHAATGIGTCLHCK